MTTYLNGQQYYHPETPQPSGGAQMQQSAEQRYAALRLQQAVAAGVIPASVLNAHPNTYPALWRMVSQKITAPAAAAGYKDPGYWLRMGGPNRPMGPPGIGDQTVESVQTQQNPGAPVDNSDIIQRFIQQLQGSQSPNIPNMLGQIGSFGQSVPPQMLQLLMQMFQQSQGMGQPNIQQY